MVGSLRAARMNELELLGASEAGDVEAVRYRLASRSPPNLECLSERRLTPLMLAAANPNAFGVLQLLLQRGARSAAVHADSGMVPLHFACAAGNAPAAFALLRAGAHPGAADLCGA
jgi:ankyrin repeat protein